MRVMRDLIRESWAECLDAITDELRNEAVSIAVADRGIPFVLESSRMVLEGVSYDRRNDVFEVAAAQGAPRVPVVLRHRVSHPTRIGVDSPTSLAPTLIEIDDGEGSRTVVTIGRAAAFTG